MTPTANSPDENENVICKSPNGLKIAENGSIEHSTQMYSSDCLVTLTQGSSVSEEDDDPAQCKKQLPCSQTNKAQQFKAQFYQKVRNGIWAFPLLLVIFVPAVCLAPYIMALLYGHVEAIFPYVSDAGGKLPQASYFSQMLDMVALLIFITSFCRYKLIKHYVRVKMTKGSPRLQNRLERCNFISLLIIYSSAFGVIIIGNFRVTESAAGHFFGVAFAFFGMFLYMCLMVYMSYHCSRFGLESRPYTMTVISLSAGVSLVGCMVFSMISIWLAGVEKFFTNEFRLNWTKQQDGFTTHVIGTAFEWVAINTVGPFYLCLFCRMKYFKDWDKVKF